MCLADFPVASGMVRLAQCSNKDYFNLYMCLWSAFNNIYHYLSDQDNRGSKLQYDTNNKPRTKEVNGYLMPIVKTEPETTLILHAIGKLDPGQIEEWLGLPEVGFFVKRTPQSTRGECQPGKPGLFDRQG
jgi:hypothetical protein